MKISRFFCFNVFDENFNRRFRQTNRTTLFYQFHVKKLPSKFGGGKRLDTETAYQSSAKLVGRRAEDDEFRTYEITYGNMFAHLIPGSRLFASLFFDSFHRFARPPRLPRSSAEIKHRTKLARWIVFFIKKSLGNLASSRAMPIRAVVSPGSANKWSR